MRGAWAIGIDEVGRGPLAGRVTTCAFAIPTSARWFRKVPKLPLRDSKKLSSDQRLRWLREIRRAARAGNALFVVRSVSVRGIDRMNISRAANVAATRALTQLTSILPRGARVAYPVILDGGLKVYAEVQQTALAKADERYPAVSLASIVAKVLRDRHMDRLGERFPRYRFGENKGYGTGAHIRALRRYGPCPEHRRSFIKNLTKKGLAVGSEIR